MIRRLVRWCRKRFNATLANVLEGRLGRGGRRFINDVLFFYLRHSVSLVLTAVTFFLTARLLGPQEYGRFIVITALSGVLAIPLTLGIPASATYHLANGRGRGRTLSTVIAIAAIVTAAVSALTVALAPYLARRLSVDTLSILYGLALAVLLSWHSTADSLLRGLYRIRALSRIRLALSIAVSGITIGLLTIGVRTFAAPLVSLLAGYWIFSTLAFRQVSGRWGRPNWRLGGPLLKYAVSASTGSIAGAVILNADKLIINSALSSTMVGIYGAYAALSLTLVDKLVFPFITALFPFSIRHKDKPGLFAKAERGVLRIFIPSLLMFVLGISIGMAILGKSYPTLLPLVLLFALAAALALCRELLWWVAISSNERAIHTAAVHNIICIVINVAATVILVKALALYGAALAQVITNGYNMVVAVYLLRRFRRPVASGARAAAP